MRALVSASMSLFLAALLVTACATGSPTTTAPSTAAPSAAGLAGSVSPSGSASLFSSTDVAWLQLTVAMNERLLPVLDMVPGRTTDPAWQTFAARLGTAHRAGLSTARRLLAESGAPATNPHEGHDMPGMVTEQELTTLRSVTGVAFQRLAGQHVRAHLQQAVRVATAEQRNGVHPATTALAAEVVRAGDAELARLDRLTP
ncbi:DUF305 domain-containing protein [Micromonospora zamorensis]|uniref:DUF305 domain-containing protein n=1 Tax=Micromonospora zamorensis TaxID=709883 RepID=UPI002ED66A87|nr:DUF305 domain-containing protein [Micromonospora zamorensis]